MWYIDHWVEVENFRNWSSCRRLLIQDRLLETGFTDRLAISNECFSKTTLKFSSVDHPSALTAFVRMNRCRILRTTLSGRPPVIIIIVGPFPSSVFLRVSLRNCVRIDSQAGRWVERNEKKKTFNHARMRIKSYIAALVWTGFALTVILFFPFSASVSSFGPSSSVEQRKTGVRNRCRFDCTWDCFDRRHPNRDGCA